jgi:hypothetical protein
MLKWVAASGGHIPSGAQSVGHEANGGPALYVARASIPGGGLQLGKVRHDFGAAYIPYGGAEVACPNYEVLMNPMSYPSAYIPAGSSGFANWPAVTPPVVLPDGDESGGSVPPVFRGGYSYAEKSNGLSVSETPLLEFHAILCGQENDGSPLFCALVAYEGGLHPGKVSLGLGGANIGFGGNEISGLSPYVVLCDASYGFLTGPWAGFYVPVGSTPLGTDDDGQSLYIARCISGVPGLQLGKVKYDGFASKGASFPYGGQEIFVEGPGIGGDYQVLFAPGAVNWVAAMDGSIPDGAVVLGGDVDGSPLFAARIALSSSIQLGKIRNGFRGAYYSWGGSEQVSTSYDVLCQP